MTATTARMLWTGLLALLPLPLLFGLWGFSVDDAWIVARVVENGLETGVLSFNRDGPRTDAITALGFAELVAAACVVLRTSDAFFVARALGAAGLSLSFAISAWTVTAEASRGSAAWRSTALWCVTAALSPSLAAWAGAGLETPLVACLCTLGCALGEKAGARGASWRRPELASLLLGCALAWRPELIGFALTSALLVTNGASPRQRLLPLLVLAAPSLVVATLRLTWFQTPFPLALSAKEPDLASGLRYGLGSLLLCGPLWLLWGLIRRRDPGARSWWLAFSAHGVCTVLAGGDWMPFYRLWVPVLPWLVAVGVRELRRPLLGLVVGALALGANGILVVSFADATREVVARRERMVAELRPHLAESRRIATVDIGWVGRATDAEIVDLAGVTDPRVAILPGGHTSKRITPGFFAARSIDTWLIRARDRSYAVGQSLETIDCVYAVDRRLARREQDLAFRGVATIAVPGTDEEYVVARYQPSQR